MNVGINYIGGTIERPPLLRLYNECFSLALRRAGRAVSRLYDEALLPLDLNNGQFSMLATIAGMGTVRIQKLAEMLEMDRTMVTAALKPLERRKLLRIQISGDDARAREVQLLAAGEQLLRKAIPIWEAQQEGVSKKLSEGDAKALRDLLGRFV